MRRADRRHRVVHQTHKRYEHDISCILSAEMPLVVSIRCYQLTTCRARTTGQTNGCNGQNVMPIAVRNSASGEREYIDDCSFDGANDVSTATRRIDVRPSHSD